MGHRIFVAESSSAGRIQEQSAMGVESCRLSRIDGDFGGHVIPIGHIDNPRPIFASNPRVPAHHAPALGMLLGAFPVPFVPSIT